MSVMGTAFLGDIQRHRIITSPTPPSSPPSSAGPMTSVIPKPKDLQQSPVVSSPPKKQALSAESPPPVKAPLIDPQLSLELRLRWLEALLLGAKQGSKDKDGKGVELKHGSSLMAAAEDVQRRLEAVVEGNEGLKRFMEHYDQHAHLLTPSFALSGVLPEPPSYASMTPSELDAFLLEMEPDIRAADRDMREIEALEKMGITGAGKLADHESLQPRLTALLAAHKDDVERALALERRIARLIERHAIQVDALSELFVAWDETINAADNKVTRLEHRNEERRRLGFE